MKVINKVRAKFESILDLQIKVGYLTYLKLDTKEHVSFEEYLEYYKEILQDRKEVK